MEPSLESLLSQLETAYFNAKMRGNVNGFEASLAQRQAIKDEIIARFSRIEDELRGYQNF